MSTFKIRSASSQSIIYSILLAGLDWPHPRPNPTFRALEMPGIESAHPFTHFFLIFRGKLISMYMVLIFIKEFMKLNFARKRVAGWKTGWRLVNSENTCGPWVMSLGLRRLSNCVQFCENKFTRIAPDEASGMMKGIPRAWKARIRALCFWAVGVAFPVPNELYVCVYHLRNIYLPW